MPILQVLAHFKHQSSPLRTTSVPSAAIRAAAVEAEAANREAEGLAAAHSAQVLRA